MASKWGPPGFAAAADDIVDADRSFMTAKGKFIKAKGNIETAIGNCVKAKGNIESAIGNYVNAKGNYERAKGSFNVAKRNYTLSSRNIIKDGRKSEQAKIRCCTESASKQVTFPSKPSAFSWPSIIFIAACCNKKRHCCNQQYLF